MNYKIRITADNQAIVKRIADENGMNQREFRFNNFFQYYTISNNLFDETLDKSDYPELTTEQFIELFDKKETELDKWLKETKAKNLSLEELENSINRGTNVRIWYSLEGVNSEQKAKILYNQWNNPTEPHICKYCHAETTQDDETCYAKPTEWQPKRGDRVLVWDNNENEIKKLIFVNYTEGAYHGVVCVQKQEEKKFLNNETFYTENFKHMKPLQTEQSKETAFKTKVIELIEKNINDKQEKLKFVIDKNNLIYEAVLECIVEIHKDLLNQIKQL